MKIETKAKSNCFYFFIDIKLRVLYLYVKRLLIFLVQCITINLEHLHNFINIYNINTNIILTRSEIPLNRNIIMNSK